MARLLVQMDPAISAAFACLTDQRDLKMKSSISGVRTQQESQCLAVLAGKKRDNLEQQRLSIVNTVQPSMNLKLTC